MSRPALLTLLAFTALNSLEAQAPQLRRLRQLDCSECVRPTGVHLSADGERVILIDGESPHVRVYSGNTLTRSFGRTGSGPGEFRGPYFVAGNQAGLIGIVDALTRQLSWLNPKGEQLHRITLPAFPSNVTQVSGGDDLLFVWNDFRGTHTSQIWPFGATSPGHAAVLPKTEEAGSPYPVAQRSDGSWAAIPAYSTYHIMRGRADGSLLPPITRDIARTRRTPEEEAERQARLARGPQKAGEERKLSKSPRPLLAPGVELSLKQYFQGSAIQYDASDKLWVLTGRGNHAKSVFDVFDANDKFAGSVEVPFVVLAFSLGGGKLALTGTDTEGLPVLEVWEIARR